MTHGVPRPAIPERTWNVGATRIRRTWPVEPGRRGASVRGLRSQSRIGQLSRYVGTRLRAGLRTLQRHRIVIRKVIVRLACDQTATDPRTFPMVRDG